MADYYAADLTIYDAPDTWTKPHPEGGLALDLDAMPAGLRDALAIFGAPDASYLYYGNTTLEWHESRYGMTSLEENVLPALRVADVGYLATDDGHYEWPGQYEEWRPGWPQPRGGTYHSHAGGKLIPERSTIWIVAKTNDDISGVYAFASKLDAERFADVAGIDHGDVVLYPAPLCDSGQTDVLVADELDQYDGPTAAQGGAR